MNEAFLGGGSLLGGLLMGLAQGQQRQDMLESERLKNELIKSQVDLHKSQTKQQQIALDQKQQEMDMLRSLMGGLTPQAQPTPLMLQNPATVPPYNPDAAPPTPAGPVFGPGFENTPAAGNGQNLTGMMALIQAHPELGMILKKAGGLDIFPALTYQNRANELAYRQSHDTKTFNQEEYLKAQETHPPVMGTDATGAQIQLPGTPKYPELAAKYGFGTSRPMMPGQSPPNLQPGPSGRQMSPGAADQPIKDPELQYWVKINPDTNGVERPKYGTTPAKAEAAGFKFASKEQIDAIAGFSQIDSVLGKISGLMEKVMPKDESVLEGKFKGNTREFEAWSQSNPDAAMLKRLTVGTLAPIIRQMGEKGALANEDVQRALALMPSLSDRGQTAWGMLNMLKDMMTYSKKAKLGSLYQEKKPKKSIADILLED